MRFSVITRLSYSVAVVMLASAAASAVAAGDGGPGIDWPQFRGPAASGIAAGKPAPVEWAAERGTGVRWKVEVPGLGHSSPVIWGDRLFLTTAVGQPQKLKPGLYGDPTSADDPGELAWKVLCFDKNNGKLLWERTAHQGVPRAKRHPKATHANATCAVDGKRVVAFFGSEGLYCYDLDGRPLWQKDFGLLDSGAFNAPDYQWGFASSPVLFDDKVVVLADVQERQKKSFLAVFDAAAPDGREIWRTERHDAPTWGTPTVHRDGDRTYVFVNGNKEMAGYDFTTGKRLWTLSGAGDVPVPTPVVAHDLVFLTSAHGPLSPIYAVRLSAEGDLTPPKGKEPSGPHVAWSVRNGGNYMQTPLVVGDYLYGCRDNGILTCWEAKTGKQLYHTRLNGLGFTASGVASADRLYFTAEDGQVQVVRTGPEFKLLATNALGEPCLATPAISDGVIYFRTEKHLVAVGG